MSAILSIELIAAALLSSAIVRIVRWSALRRGWLDKPNDRSAHRNPTPRGGGVGIVVGTVGGATAILGASEGLTRRWILVLAAAGVIALVSWFDDLNPLPNTFRFLVHIGAACGAVWALGPIRQVALPGLFVISTSGLAVFLTICWIAGLTNVYNFMDGIDGIAGLQAVAAGVTWAAIGITVGDQTLFVTAGLIAATSLGFLIHNWSPATIFMGDVGSAFLGYFFAVFGVRTAWNPVAPFAAVLAVWPFLFDSTFTIIRRLSRGENITKAHSSHLYQRLVRCGWSHSAVSSIYGVLAGLGGSFAVALLRGVPGWQAVYVVIPAAALGLWLLVRRSERRRFALLPDVSQ